jgi:hypothetical protein
LAAQKPAHALSAEQPDITIFASEGPTYGQQVSGILG